MGAAQFQHNGTQAGQGRRLLRDPQRLGRAASLREEQGIGTNAEAAGEAGRIGQARFRQRVGRCDPQDGKGCRRTEQRKQAAAEAGKRTGVLRPGAMQLGQGRERQAAAERIVDLADAKPERRSSRRDPIAPQQDPVLVGLVAGRGSRRFKPIGQAPFDPGNFPAQGAKRPLRRSMRRHD